MHCGVGGFPNSDAGHDKEVGQDERWNRRSTRLALGRRVAKRNGPSPRDLLKSPYFIPSLRGALRPRC